MLNKRVNHLIGNERLATTIRRRLIPVYGENATQFIIRIRDSTHRSREHFAKIGPGLLNIAPSGTFWNTETVLTARPENLLLLFGKLSTLLVLLLGDRLIGFILPLIAELLIKHKRQNVVLVILSGSLTPEDIRCAPEMRFELLLA